jgi:uncharacterized SAM-binding protein YcdF (DUF218 family)
LGRALLVVLLLVAVGSLVAWHERAPLLQKAAQWWIISDEPEAADAVAVLGGGVNVRPFAAAAYYQDGLVTKILLSVNDVGPAAQLGAEPSDTEANRQVLLKLGVPETAIDTFGMGSHNTFEEVMALRDWAERTGAHRIIVPTEIFPARRVRWVMHRVLGDKVTIIVPALDPLDYQTNNWWQREQGVVAFQNEILKYIFYRIRY